MSTYKRAKLQGLTFMALAIVGLYAASLVAQDADANAERLARSIRNLKSRVGQIEDSINECDKAITYAPLAAACRKWKPALLEMKAHWQKRLELLEANNTETTQELYREERDLYEKTSEAQRMYNFARTAFSHSKSEIQNHYLEAAEKNQLLNLPLQKLVTARAAAEGFYVEMSEKGTNLTMEEIGREAEVLLAVEKAKCAMEFEMSKAYLDKSIKNLENMPAKVQAARQAVIDNYTDILNLKLQRAENWANERVAEKKKYELERALHDAMRSAREARRKAIMEEEARQRAMKDEARRKAEKEAKEPRPTSDF